MNNLTYLEFKIKEFNESNVKINLDNKSKAILVKFMNQILTFAGKNNDTTENMISHLEKYLTEDRDTEGYNIIDNMKITSKTLSTHMLFNTYIEEYFFDDLAFFIANNSNKQIQCIIDEFLLKYPIWEILYSNSHL